MKIVMLSDFHECLVIRASVPKLDLDSTFEQKNDIAKGVEEELEKVMYALDSKGPYMRREDYICNFAYSASFTFVGHVWLWI